MTLKTITMDMFTAPMDSYLASGTNCKGVMGAGVAYFIKEKYPDSFEEYRLFCRTREDSNLIGTAQITDTTASSSKPRKVINLFTSKAFGLYKDQPYEILENTRKALKSLFKQFKKMDLKEMNIYSNKFNSGLFDVPWEETEPILYEEIYRFEQENPEKKINWIVCDWN